MAVRSGRTEKVTLSLDKAELSAMRRRAKRLHAGNLSAAFSELARLAVKEEALDRLLLELPASSSLALARVNDELSTPLPSPPNRKRQSGRRVETASEERAPRAK